MVWDCLLLSAQCSIFLSLPQPQQLVSLGAYPASHTQMCAFVYSFGNSFRVRLWVCPLYKQCQFSSTLDIKRHCNAIFVETVFTCFVLCEKKKVLVFHKTFFSYNGISVWKCPKEKLNAILSYLIFPYINNWRSERQNHTFAFEKRMNI